MINTYSSPLDEGSYSVTSDLQVGFLGFCQQKNEFNRLCKSVEGEK